MRIATAKEIVALELLAAELVGDPALHAVERELASAVSIVDILVGASPARAVFEQCEILEAGHASRLSFGEGGKPLDTSHERVEDVLETLALTGLHWKWNQRPKVAYACETGYVPTASGTLQQTHDFVAAAHE